MAALPKSPATYQQRASKIPSNFNEEMVGVARIELATPAMSTQCSTTELHAHILFAVMRTRIALARVVAVRKCFS